MRIRHASYYFLAFASASLLFLGFVWGPDLSFWITLIPHVRSVSGAVRFSLDLFGRSFLDAGAGDTAFYAAFSILAGANLSLLAFYFRKYRSVPSGGLATGGIAALVAALGFGCASCGTLFLSFLLSSLGGASLAILPDSAGYFLRGAGLALLAFSLWRLARHVRDPLVCPVK